MKAVRLDAHGGPEVLAFDDAPMPAAGEGQLLVRVAATGVNPADLKWRAGMFASFAPLSFPHVPGYDIAGTVEGSGRRVAAMLDSFAQGAYAEWAVAAAETVADVPDNLDFERAAAVPTPGLTGVQMIEEQLDARPGQRLLVTGATGMVGRFALHAARRRGCETIAAVRASQRDEALALGADRVLVLGEEQWTGGAFDGVADTVGGEAVAALCRHLREGGAIRTAATTPIPPDGLAAEPQFFAVHQDRVRLEVLLAAIAAGEVPIPIGGCFPLEDAAEVHRRIEAETLKGKVVLRP